MYIVIILLIMLKRQYNIFFYSYCNHIVNNVKGTAQYILSIYFPKHSGLRNPLGSHISPLPSILSLNNIHISLYPPIAPISP